MLALAKTQMYKQLILNRLWLASCNLARFYFPHIEFLFHNLIEFMWRRLHSKTEIFSDLENESTLCHLLCIFYYAYFRGGEVLNKYQN